MIGERQILQQCIAPRQQLRAGAAALIGELPVGGPQQQIAQRTEQARVGTEQILHRSEDGGSRTIAGALRGDQGGDLLAQLIIHA